MIIRLESGSRWLAARIGDFEKWQAGLLEESARRVGAVLDPGGRVHRYGFAGSPVTFRGHPDPTTRKATVNVDIIAAPWTGGSAP